MAILKRSFLKYYLDVFDTEFNIDPVLAYMTQKVGLSPLGLMHEERIAHFSDLLHNTLIPANYYRYAI